jgi:hypothetical protein
VIVSKRVVSLRAEAQRNHIVALESEIIEARCVAVPAWIVRLFAADDMGGSAHLDATKSKRAVHQGDFEFYGSAGLQFTRGEKKYTARTDIAGNQSYRNWFHSFASAHKSQGKAEGSAWIPATFVRHADSMSRDAREAAWARLFRASDYRLGVRRFVRLR